jgi:aryl-alcohol dehydrogenase-like predicted oxidoreductase
MSEEKLGGTFKLGSRSVHRMGYGAMQLAGPHVFGPPKDRAAAIAVLREAIALGIDHIDTSDFYGPHVVNQIIREALHPYPDNLTIVTKIGYRRDEQGAWLPAPTAAELTQAVHDNLRNLGLDSLAVVNLRVGESNGMRGETSLAERFSAVLELQRKGLVQHIGLSNVTARQIAEARALGEIVCVQNMYNVAQRHDDAMIAELAKHNVAFVPFFPLGGFSPLQSSELDEAAKSLGATPMQLALAWLLHHAPNILLIPGTSSVAHLRENIAAADLKIPRDVKAKLDGIGATA